MVEFTITGDELWARTEYTCSNEAKCISSQGPSSFA